MDAPDLAMLLWPKEIIVMVQGVPFFNVRIRKTENTPIEENLSGKNTTGLCLPGKYDSRRGLNSLCKPRVAIATTKP